MDDAENVEFQFSRLRRHVKKPHTLRKNQFLGPVLVFEQRIKQRQLNVQINNNSMWTYLCEFA